MGRITMVPDIIHVQAMHDTMHSNTMTVMLKDLLRNEIRLVLWSDYAVQFNAEAVCAMGHKEHVIAILVETLPKTAHGNRGLSGSSAMSMTLPSIIKWVLEARHR